MLAVLALNTISSLISKALWDDHISNEEYSLILLEFETFTLRETSKTLNWEGLKFPVNFSDINKFENHNSSISVNVFGYEKLVYPLRISEHNYKRESTVNLLLISDDTKQHYCWIKDISKLLSLQTSKYWHVRHVFFMCLNTFNSEKSLASHHEYCKSHEAIKMNFPKRDRKYFLKSQ